MWWLHQPGDTNMMISTFSALARLLVTDPVECSDRILAKFEVRVGDLWHRPEPYPTSTWPDLIRGLEARLGVSLDEVFSEVAFSTIADHVASRRLALNGCGPFSSAHNADPAVAKLAYAMVRLFKPMHVVETGVAYGVTSAFILQALEVNGRGVLHSIDLPPLKPMADEFVGALIPADLKHRWTLHRGVSKRILPGLLRKLGQVDIFIHDSLHTYRNIRRELCLVQPHLADNGVLLADDVEGNAACLQWMNRTQPAFWTALKEWEKPRLLAIGVFGSAAVLSSSTGQR